MQTLNTILQSILHIDTTLLSFVTTYGALTYLILFAVIFCETGLVVTPFLPGDSLLFTAGSIAANSNHALSIQVLFITLTIASIFGNKVNYLIGRALGPKVFNTKDSWLLNKRHLLEAHAFYEKHGGKTIILARFIPIIRTFAPFVAGVGTMNLRLFSFYNFVSAVIWIGSLLGAGYFLGSLPIVRDNFSIVIYSIIGVSLIPPMMAFILQRFGSAHRA